jgi:hypothetical protein
MENLLFAGTLALIYTVAVVVGPYILVLLLANLLCRLLAGKHFRWLSWRTLLPLLVLLAGCWGILFYGLLTRPVFLITH